MTTRTFQQRYRACVDDIARQIANDPELRLRHLTDRYTSPSKDEPPKTSPQLGNTDMVFVHVKSKCHLNRRILAREEPAELLARHCLHYARVCQIALVSYCFIDSEFHLTVGLHKDSLKLSKMVGCIKQQFTNGFKPWYNVDYRKEKNYRPARLGDGTLWIGRPQYELIEDEIQLAACMIVMESQRLAVECHEEIAALEEAPRFVAGEADGGKDGGEERSATAPCLSLQTPYEELLARLKEYRFQSTGWYLGGCKGGSDTYLTDGTDGVWATEEEVKRWFDKPAATLPTGWRKVWFQEGHGILKPTPVKKRRYPKNPLFRLLGPNKQVRGARLGRLMMGHLFGRRGLVGAIDPEGSEEPGAEHLG